MIVLREKIRTMARGLFVATVMIVASAKASDTNVTGAANEYGSVSIESPRFLSEEDYQRMLDALSKSPDVKLPAKEKAYVDGYTPTYVFVCEACGKSTRYWGRGIVMTDHAEDMRKLMQEIRNCGCDARLDDTYLCQYCHSERFFLERRPVAAVLSRGVQQIPLCGGILRYVPQELPVEVTGWSEDGGMRYSLRTDKPYSILERSSVDTDGRVTRDAYVSSFVPVWCDLANGNVVRLDKTEGVGGGTGGDTMRSLRKGDRVVVEDLPPPSGANLVDTNDYSKYCLVTTPDIGIRTYWGCSAFEHDVTNFRYETGVSAPFGPFYLSVNGGVKRQVKAFDLKVLLAFLKDEPIVHHGFDYRCTTKSRIQWLKELLLSNEESVEKSRLELSDPCITWARREQNAVDACRNALLAAAREGYVARMDWQTVSNQVMRASKDNETGMAAELCKAVLAKVDCMRAVGELLQENSMGYRFSNGTLAGQSVVEVKPSGLVVNGGVFSKEKMMTWSNLFSEHGECMDALYAFCLKKGQRRTYLQRIRQRIGFPLLKKYMVENPPAQLERYADEVHRIREDKNLILDRWPEFFPEVPLRGDHSKGDWPLHRAYLGALLDDTGTVELPLNPFAY